MKTLTTFPFVYAVQDAIETQYANRDPDKKPAENVNTLLEAFPIMTTFSL